MTDTQTEQVQLVWINDREFVALRKGTSRRPRRPPWPALTEADRVKVFELQGGVCSEHGCENQLAPERAMRTSVSGRSPERSRTHLQTLHGGLPQGLLGLTRAALSTGGQLPGSACADILTRWRLDDNRGRRTQTLTISGRRREGKRLVAPNVVPGSELPGLAVDCETREPFEEAF